MCRREGRRYGELSLPFRQNLKCISLLTRLAFSQARGIENTLGIVAAYEHGMVFTQEDITRLIATAKATDRLWTALVPYDVTIQKHFESTADPQSWGGLSDVSWYLMLQSELPAK